MNGIQGRITPDKKEGSPTMLRFALPAVFWAILASTKVRSAFSTFGFLISTCNNLRSKVLTWSIAFQPQVSRRSFPASSPRLAGWLCTDTNQLALEHTNFSHLSVGIWPVSWICLPWLSTVLPDSSMISDIGLSGSFGGST